jgi:hypothetical protein
MKKDERMKLVRLVGFLALLLVACSPAPAPPTRADVPTNTVAVPETSTAISTAIPTNTSLTTQAVTPTTVLPDATPAISPTVPQPPTLSPTNAPATTVAETQIAIAQSLFAQPTKTSGCTARNGLPDSACTPGAIFVTATTDQICLSGYSSSVRDVSTAEKDQVYAEYGVVSRSVGEYEVDHLVPLEIGGSNDVANLWPEPANPRPGFHEKDQVENYLHDQVCNGTISLQQAQEQIATNWLDVYNRVPTTLLPTASIASSPTVSAVGPSATVASTTTNVTASATVSNTAPTQNQTVVVTGKLVDPSGNGVSGASLHAVWHYKTTMSTCDGGPTNASGTASCSRDIGRATKGTPVQIDVILTLGGQTYQAGTSFVPQ